MSIYVLLTYKEYCDKVNETMTFEGLHRYKKKYWRDYYEMNQEHEQIVEELYLKKMTNDSFLLDAVQKEKLILLGEAPIKIHAATQKNREIPMG